ncbi:MULTISPECIES: lytic transglycosylase [Sulfitobacter]|uniref:transglycosylase SLT domain-containing protein n=1 Tax=Sulfitobacter TaxID=60136 RepID=UPI002307DE1A|nr:MULTISPECIES: lytic transglycosylase [Sulfitobacter]MDF3382115.1 lytic transglycosylase [Sulfitobacter sp. Ks11]MDF3385534.1 lytic transglycosylase [Sulfitobacter sp. M85]MDF3388953.1 lytic transglycosylase [Sulfitobacter sp. Ks16]MDF3399590.1 lytic transglycosylase [Sulfitobacter sp. KE39]MDF3403011.1 lytic transglycosylase [Sulfitobacter sp. Ks35]
MTKHFCAMMIVLLVASCGGGPQTAPRDLDNACTILKEHPDYLRAFRATERKWGVPIHVQMATIHQESKFVADARTPFKYVLGVIPMGRQSSAFGYSQALDATWDEYLESEGRWRAKRDRIRDASDFMGWYMNLTRERNGVSLHDARNQYLAYHEGHTGFARKSYNSKAWLVGVAGKVDSRAKLYQRQIAGCRLGRW